MSRINRTGNAAQQPIVAQDSVPDRAQKRDVQRPEQPAAVEQQQSKQAAQGRKSEMDLQGTLKKSELGQYGDFPHRRKMEGKASRGESAGAPNSDQTELRKLEDAMKEMNQVFKEVDGQAKRANEIKEKSAKKILEKYAPPNESNSCKKTQ